VTFCLLPLHGNCNLARVNARDYVVSLIKVGINDDYYIPNTSEALQKKREISWHR
jgi:hypothetical protein